MDKSRLLEAIRQGCVDPFAAARYWKDSPAPPATPDYTGAATAQGAANKESAIATAQLGNPNVSSPYGTQTVSYQNDPTTGNPVPYINQSLNPQSQQIFNQQQATKLGLANLASQGANTAQGVLNTPFNYTGPGVPQADDAARQASQNAAYQNQTSRLDPQWAQASQMNETKLRNQGLAPGDEAYDNAMRDFNFGKNDAYSQAHNNSFNTGLAAQQAQFGMGLSANQTGLQEALALRNQPLNEINALTSSSQIANPQFNGYQGAPVQASNLQSALGQQAQYNQGLYNSQVGSANATNSGLYSLGAAAIMAS